MGPHNLRFLTVLAIFLAVPAGAQEKDWEKRWSQILGAAKKEGKLVIADDPDPVVERDVLSFFQTKFGITIEHIRGRGSEVVQRIKRERQAGLYTIDLYVGGPDSVVTSLYPEKMIDPIRPVLILPEVVDPSKWRHGKIWFIDPDDRYALRLYDHVSGLFAINTDHVKREEFNSIKDLLHPKWKGKISAEDPTAPGMGSNIAAAYYQLFGEEFVKRLYIEQQVVTSRSNRQIADWLARGTHPITLTPGKRETERIQKEGLPVVVIPSLPDATGFLRGGSGVIALANRAPYPNAAAVYLNWIASKEGLALLCRAVGYAPSRNDIDPAAFMSPEAIPRPGVKYLDTYDWDFTAVKEKTRARLKELLRR